MITEDPSVCIKYKLSVLEALANNEILKGVNSAEVEAKKNSYKVRIENGEDVEVVF